MVPEDQPTWSPNPEEYERDQQRALDRTGTHGSPAPRFALSTLTGETLTLEALRALGKPIVLLFSDPGCGPCLALLPEIGRWQREQAAHMAVALISRGTVEANRPK